MIYLDIDIYLLYGGKFSPLGIAYKPYRASGPRCIRSAFEDLDSQSFGKRERHIVVLQSARQYFHTFGSFHVIPTRQVAKDRDQNWISIWRAIIRHMGLKKGENEADKIKLYY